MNNRKKEGSRGLGRPQGLEFIKQRIRDNEHTQKESPTERKVYYLRGVNLNEKR